MATQQELDDLSADLGDTNGAFEQAELVRLLERSRDESGNERHYVALAMGIFQLLTQAARFADYVVNEAQERRSEIWKNLKGTLDLLMERPDVSSALGPDSSGGFQRRAMSYTRTRTAAGEYAFPNLLNPWG
jgi:hypothetical protein